MHLILSNNWLVYSKIARNRQTVFGVTKCRAICKFASSLFLVGEKKYGEAVASYSPGLSQPWG